MVVLPYTGGQNNGDGTLTSTCNTGNYEIVLLSFLTTFGCGKTPQWNFAGHCGDWSPCTKLQLEIQHCQHKGVKVFLSFPTEVVPTFIGMTLPKNLTYALRHKYLYFYLSAAPQSPIPDHYLDKAIKTDVNFPNNLKDSSAFSLKFASVNNHKVWGVRVRSTYVASIFSPPRVDQELEASIVGSGSGATSGTLNDDENASTSSDEEHGSETEKKLSRAERRSHTSRKINWDIVACDPQSSCSIKCF
ncbi:Glycoside hydrolase superfamily [Sesbania bispinosa]|nr:Glycoside hydrolase superfamily [Sesbania bispinosa]